MFQTIDPAERKGTRHPTETYLRTNRGAGLRSVYIRDEGADDVDGLLQARLSLIEDDAIVEYPLIEMALDALTRANALQLGAKLRETLRWRTVRGMRIVQKGWTTNKHRRSSL